MELAPRMLTSQMPALEIHKMCLPFLSRVPSFDVDPKWQIDSLYLHITIIFWQDRMVKNRWFSVSFSLSIYLSASDSNCFNGQYRDGRSMSIHFLNWNIIHLPANRWENNQKQYPQFQLSASNKPVRDMALYYLVRGSGFDCWPGCGRLVCKCNSHNRKLKMQICSWNSRVQSWQTALESVKARKK